MTPMLLLSNFSNSEESITTMKGCCDKVEVVANYAGVDEEGCCIYKFEISNGSQCELYMYDANGNYYTLVAPFQELSYEYQICDGQTSTIFIGPNSDPDKACYKETFSCGEVDCCKEVEVTSTFAGINSLGCCVYKITVENKNSCELYMYDANGNIITTIPPFTTTVASYNVCPGNSAVVYVGPSINPDEACWKEQLTCDEVDCCKGVEVVSTFSGTNSQGCCVYKITVYNENECELFLFDSNGNIFAVIPPYSTVSVPYTVCPGNSAVVYVGPSTDPNQACWKEVLTCDEVDCCKDVSVTVTAIGTNPQGCCVYKVNIVNENSCELYFYDGNGNIVTIIAPYSSATATYTVCPGNNAVVYVGPSTNPDEACWKEELTCKAKNCCEGVDVNITLQGIDLEGCCVYKIVVTNNNECELVVYDSFGNIIATLPPFTSSLLNYTLCGGNSAVIYVGPNTNPDEACFKEEITCKQKDCCKEVDVTITNTGTNKEGCCVYKIVVTNNNECKIYVFDQDGNVIGIVPPFTSSLLSYIVCPGNSATIYVGPSINKDEACYKETLICAEKDCCKEVQVTTNFKGYDLEGCCVWEIIVTNNNSCPLIIYDNNGTVIANVPPFTSTLTTYTVCSGNSAVIYVGPNTITDEACYKEKLECGKQGCCKNATFQTNLVGLDKEGCCIYEIIVSNPGECKLYIFDDNGNIISIVPPMTSVLINHTVCPGNNVVIYVGASTNPDKACFKEELICEDKNCCEAVEVQANLAGIDQEGCCVFKIDVHNGNECELYVYDDNGNVIAIVSPYSNLTVSYTVCPGNSAIVYVGPNTNPDEACWKEQLVCEDTNCCEEVVVESSFQGYDLEGCCVYEIKVENNNNCKLYIYDQNGNVYAGVPAYSTLSVNITVCPGNSTVIYVGPNTNPDEACWKEEFVCESFDCCEGVEVDINYLGVDEEGCCVYKINVVNNNDCKIFIFDSNGNVYTYVFPNSTYSMNITVCPGNSLVVYFGPTIDPDDACYKEELTCVQTDCCKDVEVQSTFKGYDEEGCCIYNIQVYNGNSCELYIYDQNGNVYAVVPPFSNVDIDITVCPGNNTTIFVGPSLNKDEACWKEGYICESVECCVEVSAWASFIEMDDEGCCVFEVVVYNYNDCVVYLYDENGNVYATVPPNTTVNVKITVCQGTLDIFVGPNLNPNDACWKDQLVCEGTNCCTDVDVQPIFLGYDIQGCCYYEIQIFNGNDCELVLYTANGAVITTIAPFSNVNFNFTICQGGGIVLYVGPSTNPAEACFTSGFGCGPNVKGDQDDNLEIRTGEIEELSSIKVYPNPFNDNFKMEYVSTNEEAFKVTIYDLDGSVVRTLDGKLTKGINTISIDNMQDLPANLYFYRFETGDVSIYNKIIKQ